MSSKSNIWASAGIFLWIAFFPGNGPMSLGMNYSGLSKITTSFNLTKLQFPQVISCAVSTLSVSTLIPAL